MPHLIHMETVCAFDVYSKIPIHMQLLFMFKVLIRYRKNSASYVLYLIQAQKIAKGKLIICKFHANSSNLLVLILCEFIVFMTLHALKYDIVIER